MAGGPGADTKRHLSELLANVGMLHNQGAPSRLEPIRANTCSPVTACIASWSCWCRPGLTSMQALEAGTRRAAEMIRADRAFGTVEVGKRADLLILGANPLTDIRNTRSLEVVLSEGHVVDRTALLAKVR